MHTLNTIKINLVGLC